MPIVAGGYSSGAAGVDVAHCPSTALQTSRRILVCTL